VAALGHQERERDVLLGDVGDGRVAQLCSVQPPVDSAKSSWARR
jgi:hypothetical protein